MRRGLFRNTLSPVKESDGRKVANGDAKAHSGEKAEGEATVKEHLPELDLIRQAEGDSKKSPPPDGVAPDGAPLAAGSRLGRYEIRALLGAGGMGRVYRAHDPTLNREVAIKALAHAFQNDSASMRRFEREARVLVPDRIL